MTELTPKQQMKTIILASGSPRRRELLASLGIDFEVIPPQVDEKSYDVTGLSPREKVLHLARFKGQSVASQYPDAIVISADTLVVLNDEILEKPTDEADAFSMLSRLQGQVHTVESAIAVFSNGEVYLEALSTRVKMRALTESEIRNYIATGEPMDKAGAYAIQGYGSVLVEWIEGCYFNVVGMSMVLLNQLFRQADLRLVL